MSSSTSSFTVVRSPRYKCNRTDVAVLKTVKRGENTRRRYWSCPQWPPCKFFEWYVGEVGDGSEYNLRDKDAIIEKLVGEKKLLEDKIGRLRKKIKVQREEKMKMMYLTVAIVGLSLFVLVFKLG